MLPTTAYRQPEYKHTGKQTDMVTGIVLAAGEGTRLRPYTEKVPKCMVPYKGKPLLDYIVETFHQEGVNDLVLVRGYKGETIQRTDLQYYTNEDYDRTNMVYTLFCAEDALRGDVIISYGDIIYRPEVLQALLKSNYDFSVVVDSEWRALWEQRMSNPLDDAETMKLDASGKIVELGKKPKSYDEIQGQYIGLIKIGAHAIDKVRQFYHAMGKEKMYDGKDFNNMYMTSFIQEVIDNLMPVHAVSIAGGWLEFDSVEDLALEFIG